MRSPWMPWAALLAVTLLAYLPALRSGFIWDDDDYVSKNQCLRSTEGLRRIWCEPGAVPQYYPLVHTTYWLEYRAWGLHPAGYHAVNVLLHALNASLVVLLLKRLQVPGAWLAGALFALHPVHVESVAWITERKNVLSGCFYLASLLVYLRAWEVKPARSRRAKAPDYDRRLYYASLALFLAALLSKTVTATLPAAILLIVWWKHGRITRPDVWPLLPMFALGVTMGAFTGWMERTHVGARGVEFDWSFAERLLIAGRAVWFYAAKLAWPRPLTFIYPRWNIDDADWTQWLFPLSAAAVPITLYLLRSRLGRGPLVCVLYFGGTLFPALGFVNVYPMVFSYVADHFQYLASLGLITLAAASVARLASATAPQMKLAYALPAAWLALFAVATWQQTLSYRDERTLWQDTLAKNPDGWMPNLSLGTVILREGRAHDTLPYLQRADQISPRNARVHLTLADAYLQLGQWESAREHALQSIEHTPFAAQAHYKAAQALEAQGESAEAISHYQQAVAIDRSSAVVFFKLGRALVEQERYAEAAQAFRDALLVEPGAVQAHFHLGLTCEQLGDNDAALFHFREAVRHDPRLAVAHNQLGTQLLARGRMAEATRHLRLALGEDPDLVDAQLNLAVAIAQQGNLPQAVRMLRAAAAAHPDNHHAHANLANALLQSGDVPGAIAAYREALRIKPDWPEVSLVLGRILRTNPNVNSTSLFPPSVSP